MPPLIVMFQIARIQAIDNDLPVKIDIDTRSKKIQIEGEEKSLSLAVNAVQSIFFELEKEERNKLEADSLLKEVITYTDFLVSVN